MSETTTAPEATETTQPQPTATEPATRDATQTLGEAGLKALHEEREQRKRLEAEVNALKPIKEQIDALRGAFGPPSGGDEKAEDVVKGLQAQMAQMQHDRLVESEARRLGITDDADVDLLRGITDPDAMRRLAERLRPSTTAPHTPAPDPGQGARPSDISAEDAEYAAFYPPKPIK